MSVDDGDFVELVPHEATIFPGSNERHSYFATPTVSRPKYDTNSPYTTSRDDLTSSYDRKRESSATLSNKSYENITPTYNRIYQNTTTPSYGKRYEHTPTPSSDRKYENTISDRSYENATKPYDSQSIYLQQRSASEHTTSRLENVSDNRMRYSASANRVLTTPSSYPNNFHLATSGSTHIERNSKVGRCNELFNAKNEIIEQKDVIMQKQKTIINQLRQTNLELEERLMQKHQQQPSVDYVHLSKQLREYKFENAQLKQKLQQASATGVKQFDYDKLKQKLGESEFEEGKLQIALKEMEISKNSEVTKLSQQLEMKYHSLSIEKKKSETILQELKDSKQETIKLQLYLEELPTSEEYRELKNQLKNISKEKETIEEENNFLNKRSKEMQQDDVRQGEELKKTQMEIKNLRDELKRIQACLKERDEKGPVSISEYEQVKYELQSSVEENERLKQSLEKRTKKLNRLHYEILEKQKHFEEGSKSYKEAIESLGDQIRESDISITKVNARNQELLSLNMDYQEKFNEYKSRYSEEYIKKLNNLFFEMKTCMSEVQSFGTLCSSRLKGVEPDLTSLLGLKDSPDKPPSSNLPNGSDEARLPAYEKMSALQQCINETRKEIEQVRHHVSEQYAQEVGNMCITQ